MPQRKQKLIIIIGHEEKGVSFDAFETITRTTVNLLRWLDFNTLTEEKTKSTKWQISQISMESPLRLMLEPVSVELDDTRDIVGRYIEDINRLENNERPKYFTPKMEQKAKIITRAFYGGVTSIRFISDDIEANPTQHLAANVDEAMRQNAPYFEVGAIEGYLEAISVHNRDTVQIWDSRFNIAVECNISEYQLKEAYEYLRPRIAEGKKVRVAVRGNIKYKARMPKAVVDVYDIRMLRDSQHLPQPEDIGRVDLTGDIDPVDYLRGDYA
jgi:hypothetical protein